VLPQDGPRRQIIQQEPAIGVKEQDALAHPVEEGAVVNARGCVGHGLSVICVAGLPPLWRYQPALCNRLPDNRLLGWGGQAGYTCAV